MLIIIGADWWGAVTWWLARYLLSLQSTGSDTWALLSWHVVTSSKLFTQIGLRDWLAFGSVWWHEWTFHPYYIILQPGDWRYICIDMYFRSPGVTSIDVIALCRLWTETPNLGELGVTDLDQLTFSETRVVGLSDDTKIVSIGWQVWSQLTSVSDRQTKLVYHKDDRSASARPENEMTLCILVCRVKAKGVV